MTPPEPRPRSARALDRLLSPADQARVVAAIGAAEARSTGQIKVHVEAHCPEGAWQRASTLFTQLGLEQTRARNGVLLYLATTDRQYAILGDIGIHQASAPGLWEHAAARLKDHLTQGAIADGLIAAVALIGDALAARFPPPADGAARANELPDDLTTREDVP